MTFIDMRYLIIIYLINVLLLIPVFSKAQCDVEVVMDGKSVYHNPEIVYENEAYEKGIYSIYINVSWKEGNWYLLTYLSTNMSRWRNFKARLIVVDFKHASVDENFAAQAETAKEEIKGNGVRLKYSSFPISEDQLMKLKKYGIDDIAIGDTRTDQATPKLNIFENLIKEQIKCIENYLK